jgi:hypothetical protein
MLLLIAFRSLNIKNALSTNHVCESDGKVFSVFPLQQVSNRGQHYVPQAAAVSNDEVLISLKIQLGGNRLESKWLLLSREDSEKTHLLQL